MAQCLTQFPGPIHKARQQHAFAIPVLRSENKGVPGAGWPATSLITEIQVPVISRTKTDAQKELHPRLISDFHTDPYIHV